MSFVFKEGNILVQCDKCHGKSWIENDPCQVGAGYPYGWQWVDCRCGGRMSPVMCYMHEEKELKRQSPVVV